MLLFVGPDKILPELLCFAFPGSFGNLCPEFNFDGCFETLRVSRLQGLLPGSGFGQPTILKLTPDSCVVILTLISDENAGLDGFLHHHVGDGVQQGTAGFLDFTFGVFLPMVVKPSDDKLSTTIRTVRLKNTSLVLTERVLPQSFCGTSEGSAGGVVEEGGDMMPAPGGEAESVVDACDVDVLFGPMFRNAGSSVLMSNVESTSLGLWMSGLGVPEGVAAGVGVSPPWGPNFSRYFVARSL